jgi:putative RNA 2'-phosphotransferase
MGLDKSLVRKSVRLSDLLRHSADKEHLARDVHGWIDVDLLLEHMAKTGTDMSMDELRLIVSENDKKRFAFSGDSKKIRALQGHTMKVDLQLTVKVPPPKLYHGTLSSKIGSIRKHGLLPGDRHDVHLSADQETAVNVASRRKNGVPVILVINTSGMLKDGVKFKISDNGVWLVPEVPAKYLEFPQGM